MDDFDLLSAMPDSKEEHISLLFEAGAQPEETFLAFKSEHDRKLHSLYVHPQLTEFQNYGHWLLEVENKEQLKDLLDRLPGCVAVIVSRGYPPSLAIQLSRACTIVPPERSAVLVRFYIEHVITVLAQCAGRDWHSLLFNGITQWWLPGEERWQPLAILTSEVESPTNHTVRVDTATWQQIADRPDVTSILNEWRKMPTSGQFTPCAQRSLVIKALNKAEAAGLTMPVDQKLYALCYLNGGKTMLESDAVQASLANVARGRRSLAEILTRYAGENGI